MGVRCGGTAAHKHDSHGTEDHHDSHGHGHGHAAETFDHSQ